VPARKKVVVPDSAPSTPAISLRGARQHNLKGLDLDFPLGKLTVVTGPSGSGKSSLAFHTLYAEGQRRYVETFSPYVRQFFDRMDKPVVERIDGIPPAIAIEQKNHVRTTRSTVGTLTELNDYLKLLFARLATGYDPHTGEEIRPDSPESAAAWAESHLAGQTVLVTFPVPVPKDTPAAELFPLLNQQGYLRVLNDGKVVRTDEPSVSQLSTLNSQLTILQDRVAVTPENRTRLLEALETAFHFGKGHAALVAEGATKAFSNTWSNPATGFTLRPPSAALFSFNNPLGACPKCRGFGRVIGIDLDKAVPDPSLTIKQGAIKPFQGERGDECQRDLLKHCKERRIDLNTPWEELEDEVREWIYYGDRKSSALSEADALEELWRDGKWYGVKGFFDWLETKAYKMHVRIFLSRYRSYTACPECRGKRLQPEALCFKIDGKTLPDLWAMPVSDLSAWFSNPQSAIRNPQSRDPSLDLVITEITSRLYYLGEVGLGYLTLDRPTRTLSGGEIERVNLTTCLGAALTGTLFVLDEPTVGLHPRDIHRLVGVMHGLRDKGNTLVVVEHEEAVMRAADHLVDLGPGSGQFGGELVYQGDPAGVASGQGPGTRKEKKADKKVSSLKTENCKLANSCGTLPWLTGKKSIPVPKIRRSPGNAKLQIRGATRHNLRKLDVDLPLGLFCCLTGVSGSGKSTFVHDVLYLNLARKLRLEAEGEPARIAELLGTQYLNGVELVDQSPVARTPRSTPAVFLGAFDPIRQLFALTDDAKARELATGFFSFNSGDGRCDRCSGAGFEKVEMQFLSDLYVTCPDCNGRRYKPSTLDLTYAGKSIADILEMTVDESITFYSPTDGLPAPLAKRHNQIVALLQPLTEVGLGYLKLGQPLNTLSGGEAQRLKLCQLLASAHPSSSSNPQSAIRSPQSKLLILDEPTTGLHFTDIERLLGVFQRLVDAGHSLLVIEHNLDVIKCADWILDLGPEAGANGGQLVGEGSPEHIANLGTETARFLKPVLAGTANASLRPSSIPNSEFQIPNSTISLSGARHHNLKNVSLEIPRDQFVVISGLSGSGKSTLAFDILFAEGQRRFLDSMSAYARQFAEQLEKPEIDRLAGLPPTVAIEQRVSQGGGKSTVATVTELWNFIRLLYAKLGVQHCPDCGVPVEKQSLAAIENTIRGYLKKGPVSLLAPLIRARKGFHTEVAEWALKHGYTKLLVDGKFRDAEGFTRLERFKEHDIDVEVASFQGSVFSKKKTANASSLNTENLNLANSLERALDLGKGVIRLFTPDKKFVLLSREASCPCCRRSFDDLDPRLFSFNSPHGWCPGCRGHGVVPKKRRVLDTSKFESVLEAEIDADRAMERMEDEELVECPACHGTRLNPDASAVHLQGVPVRELARLGIDHAAKHFEKLRFGGDRESLIARDILPEIRQRLAFLQQVGLGYLQLDRSAKTLSGGESQRIRLAAQLGSNLRGVLYVLDEPTIGLHPRDNAALLDTLVSLRDKGNSLLVVEHDEDTIARADHLIDLGPGAGRLGGEVVYQGKPPGVASGQEPEAMEEKGFANSPTWRALTDLMKHPSRGERRAIPGDHPHLIVTGCRANNLKDVDLWIPVGRLTVFTGISGSGKSTLMHACLADAARAKASKIRNPRSAIRNWNKASGFERIANVYEVDQSPIGKTSRSCPATYVKVFDDIRALYAQMPEARLRGFDTSRFSFNTEGGRCAECGGNGRVKLEMEFLPSTWVHCEACNGARYNPATLEVEFRDKTIGDVLAMTIDEAAVFFESQPRIARPLKLMADTGLGYLQLGQPSPTLSGGEAQRIKLVSEIARGRSMKQQLRDVGDKPRNLYLIEEPTVGLHLEDVRRLIDVLHRLVDEGHTVVVIEHHMAVAAEADHVIDLGPEAGDNGGKIIAQGTPEQVAKSKQSRTAPFLKAELR
jgi:excinuclease ABC subunit A